MAIESHNDKLKRLREHQRKYQRPYDNLLLTGIAVSIGLVLAGAMAKGYLDREVTPVKPKETCVQVVQEKSDD